MNVLTVIVIVIFAISLLRGYQKGFIKSFASLASVILSIVLVNFATPYVTGFLKDRTPVYHYIVDKCEEAFPVSQPGASAQRESGSFLEEEVIDNLPVPEILKKLLKENNTPEYYKELAVRTFSEYVPSFMANLILSIISFVATWILVITLIWLVIMTLDFVANLPVIRGINQVLGLGLGFLQGLIIVWIGFLIITVFSHTDAGRQLMSMISESPILETLYNTNVLLDFLTSLLGNFA